ncbi:MAG: CerR family C-terminal domain-containing protein [Verrucomicrobiae bacterium]
MKEKEVQAKARERLLEAAGEVFSEVGFDGATIREITRRARVNLAAVNYYFRDKAELYSAVLMHMQRSAIDPAQAGGSSEARLRDFIRGMLKHLLDPLRPAWHSRLMAREMAAPTRKFPDLIDEGFRPKVELLDGILRDLTDGRLSDEEIARASASILAQCVFYRQNRAVILRLYPDLRDDGDQTDKLTEHIAAFSLGGLEGLKKLSPEKLTIGML